MRFFLYLSTEGVVKKKIGGRGHNRRPGTKLSPYIASACAVVRLLVFLLIYFFLLSERPPNTTGTMAGEQDLIYRPAPVRSYTPSLSWALREKTESKKKKQLRKKITKVGLVCSCLLLACYTTASNIKIIVNVCFALWWSVTEKDKKNNKVCWWWAGSTTLCQHVQHTAMCREFHSDSDVPGLKWLAL